MRKACAILAYAIAFCAFCAVPTTPASATVPPAAVVYVVGDSLVEGSQGLQGPHVRGIAQRLFDRIKGEGRTGLVEVSHGGECLLTTPCSYPTTLVSSWETEVLSAVPAPTTVIVEIGTNDLQHRTGTELLWAMAGLVDAAYARGIRVLVCTIPPRGADMWPSYWLWGPDRDVYNNAIKSFWPGNIIDLDTAIGRNDDTWAMDPRYDSGDHIHGNEWAYTRIADAIPLGRIQ